MEQIQFIYFQYCMQYYTVHHIENRMYMEIWHRGCWFKLCPQLPVCFVFSIVRTFKEKVIIFNIEKIIHHSIS